VVADIEGASQRIQEDVYRGTKVALPELP